MKRRIILLMLVFLISVNFAFGNYFFDEGYSFSPDLSNVTYLVPTGGLNCTELSWDDYCLNITGGEYEGSYCMISSTPIETSLTTGILLINIYSEDDYSLITEEITIDLYNDLVSYSNTTVSGSINYKDLSTGSYTAQFYGDNFNSRSYNLTIGKDTETNLNAYLTNSSEPVVFTLVDSTSRSKPVEGLTFTVEKFITDSWVVVGSLSSDITGKVAFSYNPTTRYKFTITGEGYDTKTFELNPIIYSTYTVPVVKSVVVDDNSDFAGVSMIHSPKNYKEGDNNFTFFISNPDGSLEYYGFNATFPGGSSSYSGSNAYGETKDIVFNIDGANFGDKVVLDLYYKLNSGDLKEFRYNYDIIPIAGNNTIEANRDKTYGMTLFERVLTASIVSLALGGVATFFTGAIPGLVVGLFVFSFFSFTGFIPKILLAIPVFVGFLLVAWRSSR